MRGSIVKRAGEAKKDGKPIEQYYVVYDVGLKWDEKKGEYVRRQKWEKVLPPNTRKHAEQLLAERLSQVHKGEFIEPTKITFREFKKTWVKKYAEGQVRPSTMALYQGHFRKHLLPAFGDMEIARIGVEDIQALKSSKLAEGYAPQTVKHMLRLMRQMLEHAVDWEYIRTNPAKKVAHPRIPRKEMDFLAPEEIRLFLAHVPVRWYAFFLTAITTGLRIGELLAMKWGNLDWEKEQYFVREIYARRRAEYEGGFAEPKTEESKQPIDLSPSCLRTLQEHRKKQTEEKLKTGKDYMDIDLIFATAKGTPLDHKNIVHRQFFSSLKDAGLRRIRFHDLRHTCASLLINQGESPKYIQKQLRHASIETTFNRYGHLFPEKKQEAMRRMDEALFGVQEKGADYAVSIPI
jgi:integrase